MFTPHELLIVLHLKKLLDELKPTKCKLHSHLAAKLPSKCSINSSDFMFCFVFSCSAFPYIEHLFFMRFDDHFRSL